MKEPTPSELSELFINGFKPVKGETLKKLKADIKSVRNGRRPSFFEANLLEYLDNPYVFSFIRDEPGKDTVVINKIISDAVTGSWWRRWRKDRKWGFKVRQDNDLLSKLLSNLKEEDENER